MIRLVLLLSFTILAVLPSFSQAVLSVDEAISIALEKNYDIVIARNDGLIDQANNTLGNSGFLPNINISGGRNYAENTINQVLTTQTGTREITRSGATNSSQNASLSLSWVLFDGGKMFVTKHKFHEMEAQGELVIKAQVLQTIRDVIGAYYYVVKQKQQLLSLKEVISYNTERVKILEATYINGLSPKNFLLQARIDLNVYKENSIAHLNSIAASKRALNQLLGRNSETDFDVSETIPSSVSPDKEDLYKKLLTNNISLLILENSQVINQLTIKELGSLRLPKITLNSAYNLSKIENSAGNLLRNNSDGALIGATVSIPLFQGGNITRQINVAKIQYQSGSFAYQDARLKMISSLKNALDEYDTQSELLKIEIENEAMARENLTIALGRLRLGESTALEARQAQESFVESQTRRINFMYNLKLAESQLKQMVADFK